VGERAVDPRDLLDRLRGEHQVLQWQPLPPEEPRAPSGEPTSERSSLEYLHHHWALPDEYGPQDSGGLRSRLEALFGRLTFRVLRPYLQDERRLLSHMVQTNEALAQRCDELARRVEQLSQEITDRQVAEAENQTKLALWLHLEPPAATVTGPPRKTTPTQGGSSSSR
jgi:hypothetical protein